MKVFLTLFLLSIAPIRASAQTTTTIKKSQNQITYEARENAFKKNQKEKKITTDSRAESAETQASFRKKREALTEAYQADLKKIEQAERKAMDEIRKKYEALAKESAH